MKKDNVVMGMIGAVLGALLGSILWILIAQLGFIAGIAGYAIVFCSIKGYTILGGNISKKGIIICVIFSLLMILLSEYISIGIAVQEVLNEYYIDVPMSEAFSSIPLLLEDSEFVAEVIKSLLIGYALAIFASFSYVRTLWNAASNTKEEFVTEVMDSEEPIL